MIERVLVADGVGAGIGRRSHLSGLGMGRARVGVSGWSYRGWRGDFYPDELRQKDELAFAAGRFDSIEVNGTFYGLTKPSAFRHWRDTVPDDFVLAIKGNRFITHNKKLADLGAALSNFLASGVLELGSKLGPLLWQVSESLHFDGDRVEAFLARLPKTFDQAADLARRHDDRIEEVSYGSGENHRIRHALEVRHESFFCDEMASIARRHGVAIVFSHSSKWPYTEQVTAGFVYLRLHGPGRLYASAYGDSQLRRWGDRIEHWRDGAEPEDAERFSDLAAPDRKGRDVYVYFDNDEGGHAPREALKLKELLDSG